MFKVLVVEDDLIAANYLKKIIESLDGFKAVSLVRSYKEALELLQKEAADIIFIDILLIGKKDGIDLAKTISAEFPDAVFIFLTAYSNREFIREAAKTNALNYLLKPYRPNEIEAVLILAKNHLLKEKCNRLNLADGYVYSFLSSRLFKNGKEIPLSPKELELIQLLAKNRHAAIDKETLLTLLEISEEALRALIYRIRAATSKKLIKTYKGVGYKLEIAIM